jgi:hypothetical protein
MVKLHTVPDSGTIRALKGSVDFYTWKGISVARSWPRKPKLPLAPAALQAQRWLQLANQHYRASSSLIKGDFHWLTLNTTWTPRDAYMGYFFGTIPWPREGLPGADPNPPPYPIPDPNSHYGAMQARVLITDSFSHPWLTIDTTQSGAWRLAAYFGSDVHHTWRTRSRYGHVYPTTPHWTLPTFFPQVPQWNIGTVYSWDIRSLSLPGEPRRMYFFFYIEVPGPTPPSRATTYLMHIDLPARERWDPLVAYFAGGPLVTQGPNLGRSLAWHIGWDLYPTLLQQWFPTGNAPRYPGPSQVPPS